MSKPIILTLTDGQERDLYVAAFEKNYSEKTKTVRVPLLALQHLLLDHGKLFEALPDGATTPEGISL